MGAAAAAAFALRLLTYIHTAMMTATKRTALTMMPISPPRGNPLCPELGGASLYFSEKTWLVINARPDTVGVDAGTNAVTRFE